MFRAFPLYKHMSALSVAKSNSSTIVQVSGELEVHWYTTTVFRIKYK
jgi:hypothetical protein